MDDHERKLYNYALEENKNWEMWYQKKRESDRVKEERTKEQIEGLTAQLKEYRKSKHDDCRDDVAMTGKSSAVKLNDRRGLPFCETDTCTPHDDKSKLVDLEKTIKLLQERNKVLKKQNELLENEITVRKIQENVIREDFAKEREAREKAVAELNKLLENRKAHLPNREIKQTVDKMENLNLGNNPEKRGIDSPWCVSIPPTPHAHQGYRVPLKQPSPQQGCCRNCQF